MAFNASNFTDEAKALPVILLLDISGSMSGSKISTLNQAVRTMLEDFKRISSSDTQIRFGVITFESEARVHIPLQNVENVSWSDLHASGGTNLRDAMILVKKLIEDRNVIPSRSYRPTVILVSDGWPFDGWEDPMNAFITSGRSSKADRMSMLIGDNSAAQVMQQFLRGSGNQLFFARDAGDISQFFHFATMTTTQRIQSQTPDTTVAMPAFSPENTIAATVTTEAAPVSPVTTVIVNNDEGDEDE